MHRGMMNSLAIISASICGLVVAQLPAETPIAEWSKLGALGVCLFIIWYMATKTMPAQQAASDKRIETICTSQTTRNEAICAHMDKGFCDVKESIDNGNQRTAELLQAALTRTYEKKQ